MAPSAYVLEPAQPTRCLSWASIVWAAAWPQPSTPQQDAGPGPVAAAACGPCAPRFRARWVAAAHAPGLTRMSGLALVAPHLLFLSSVLAFLAV